MKKLLLTLMLAVVSSGIAFNTGISLANAQEDDSIYGTHAVLFVPNQAGGEMKGCTLVYRAVQADYAYLDGKPVVIVGNIRAVQFDEEISFSLKIGVKDLVGSNQIVRPHFAYLQTKFHSTAKVKQKAMDSDEGYRIFAYTLYDKSVLDLLNEMILTRKVTIGFNRAEKGMDVLVPIDLDVIDAEYTADKKVIRKRSKETLLNFSNCFLTLINQAAHSLDKKKE